MTESSSGHKNTTASFSEIDSDSWPIFLHGSLENNISHDPESLAIASLLEDEYFVPIKTVSSESHKASTNRKYSGRSASPWIWRVARNKEVQKKYGDEHDDFHVVDENGIEEIPSDNLNFSKLGFHLSEILGFHSNPFIDDHRSHSNDPMSRKNSPMADLRLSMLSNLSTSYNTLSVSWAIQMISKIYSINEGEQSLCSTALLAGMILGQLFGGVLGDYIGRHNAMMLMMLTQIFAALASAFCFERALLVSFFGYHFDYLGNLTMLKKLAGE